MSIVQIPNILRTLVDATIPKCYSFSVQNTGDVDGYVNSSALKPGETLSFAAQNGRYYKNVEFEPNGTELLITYN